MEEIEFTEDEFQWMYLAMKRSVRVAQQVAGGKAIGRPADRSMIESKAYERARQIVAKMDSITSGTSMAVNPGEKLYLQKKVADSMQYTQNTVMPELSTRAIKNSKYLDKISECKVILKILSDLKEKLS